MTVNREEHVRAFFDLSTAHLTPETINWLQTGFNEEHAERQARTHGGALPLPVGETDHGFFVWAGSDESEDINVVPTAAEADRHHIPADLAAARKLARKQGCPYILFDADGPDCEDLPVYDHESPAEKAADTPSATSRKPRVG